MQAAKAVAAAIGAVVTVLITILADDTMTAQEAGVLVTTVLTAVGVYAVPNRGVTS